MRKVSALLLGLSCVWVGARGEMCAGCPLQVDVLTEAQKGVVDFAVLQLEGGEGGVCKKKLVGVKNFTQQVVAGYRYKFDLVLEHNADNPDECETSEETPESCRMDVYEVPWRNVMEVLWENVNCAGRPENSPEDKPETSESSKLLRVPLMKAAPQLRVGIVDLSNQQPLLGSGDHDKIPHGKPLFGFGDHDKVPHGKPFFGKSKPLFGSGDHDKVQHGSHLLGSDGHDLKPHVSLLGAKPHGPQFNDEYTMKELKSVKQSKEELKKLQSLGAFHDFMSFHNKSYATKEDYKFRYGVFKQNMKKVQFLQESELGTAVYGPTVTADLTETEFKKNFLGMKTKWNKLSDDPDIHWPAADIPDVELPKEVDWREKGAVTEVKNQGMCGSCWAFSVTGNVEGQYAVKYGQLLDLSEQELVDCDTRDGGCNGGLPENAYKTLFEIGGLESEADYGYDGKDEACKFNRSKVAARVSGGLEISTNETQMAQWLLKNGPISVGLNANAMQFYKGGVSHPFKFLCSPDGIDHGVLIVGFGEHEYPLFKKKMPYWIIKNSWGTGWGEQGYYRLYRGDGTCGINMMTSSAVVE
eukprot:GFUD01016219.1.p1 GENE.GFUD01016219.1~~GFUD01016219.1.p1  ORF type:complete len:603 (-),score=178.52 GFUD01016219.1:232-1977(-)